MMTFTQIVKMSVTTTDNNPSQGYTHPDDHTTQLHLLMVTKTKANSICYPKGSQGSLSAVPTFLVLYHYAVTPAKC